MILLADKNGCTDSAYHTLVSHIKCELPLVMVSWVDDFVFNEELLSVKDYVLICFCEYGWNFKIVDSHIWGVNTQTVSHRYSGKEWDKFDNWVKENKPKLFFKRELLKKDVTDIIRPIEYPCTVPEYEMQLKEDFNNRPINVFQYWGRSNECRLRIHGEIWLHAFKKGFQVCDNLYYCSQYLAQEAGEKWITLWIPHWARVEIKNLIGINGLSKLSLSWEGSGFKCFRTLESPVNSVLVQHKNDFAWSFAWDETNCILVDFDNEIEGIELALSNNNLYSIYLKGMQTANKYRIENYVPYLENQIKKVCG